MSENGVNLVLLIPQMRRGGAERVVSRLSYLLRADYNVKIVVFDNTVMTYEVGCDLYSLNVAPISNKNYILKVINATKRIIKYRKFKEKYSVDITYSFGDTANLVNILSFKKDKKIISYRGFRGVKGKKNLLDKFLFKPISVFLSRKADRIVSVSKLISETIATEYNISRKKIYTSYNGYEINEIYKKSFEVLDGYEKQIFINNKVLITAGTFKEEKGYWHLLKSFAELKKTQNNIKLVILGENYLDNEDKLKKLADELKITNDLVFFGYKSNPYKYFSKSTAYVLSSTNEGFPNAMVEAMCCGVPIIASDCQSGPREILAPSTNIFDITETFAMEEYGILVKRMSKKENYNFGEIEDCDIYLKDAINRLIDDENLIKHYSEKSKIRAAHFSSENWLREQIQIISL